MWLPVGRGQSGAPSGAGHSRLAPALNAAATPHWRTRFALGGAWINKHSSGYIKNRRYIQAKHLHCTTEDRFGLKVKVDNIQLDLKADRVLTRHWCHKFAIFLFPTTVHGNTHTHTQADSWNLFECTMHTYLQIISENSPHTLSPSTLCESQETALINLGKTTLWQGEAFISCSGG